MAQRCTRQGPEDVPTAGGPERTARNTCICARPAPPGGGHRPCPGGRPIPGGRWPFVVEVLRALVTLLRAGGGKAGRVSRSRPEGRQHPHRLTGRGHRPCHGAAPGSGPAGGPKPPASACPTPGGRFSPAGSGAGLCVSWTDRSTGHRPARAGETRVAFPDPARTGVLADARSLWQGPSPLPQRHADPWPAGGQSPRPVPAAPPAGAGRCRCGWHRSWWQRHARAGESSAFPDPAQRGNPLPRTAKTFPAGRRSDCCFSTLSGQQR